MLYEGNAVSLETPRTLPMAQKNQKQKQKVKIVVWGSNDLASTLTNINTNELHRETEGQEQNLGYFCVF